MIAALCVCMHVCVCVVLQHEVDLQVDQTQHAEAAEQAAPHMCPLRLDH